jgi:hypothetical protein
VVGGRGERRAERTGIADGLGLAFAREPGFLEGLVGWMVIGLVIGSHTLKSSSMSIVGVRCGGDGRNAAVLQSFGR